MTIGADQPLRALAPQQAPGQRANLESAYTSRSASVSAEPRPRVRSLIFPRIWRAGGENRGRRTQVFVEGRFR